MDVRRERSARSRTRAREGANAATPSAPSIVARNRPNRRGRGRENPATKKTATRIAGAGCWPRAIRRPARSHAGTSPGLTAGGARGARARRKSSPGNPTVGLGTRASFSAVRGSNGGPTPFPMHARLGRRPWRRGGPSEDDRRSSAPPARPNEHAPVTARVAQTPRPSRRPGALADDDDPVPARAKRQCGPARGARDGRRPVRRLARAVGAHRGQPLRRVASALSRVPVFPPDARVPHAPRARSSGSNSSSSSSSGRSRARYTPSCSTTTSSPTWTGSTVPRSRC